MFQTASSVWEKLQVAIVSMSPFLPWLKPRAFQFLRGISFDSVCGTQNGPRNTTSCIFLHFAFPIHIWAGKAKTSHPNGSFYSCEVTIFLSYWTALCFGWLSDVLQEKHCFAIETLKAKESTISASKKCVNWLVFLCLLPWRISLDRLYYQTRRQLMKARWISPRHAFLCRKAIEQIALCLSNCTEASLPV